MCRERTLGKIPPWVKVSRHKGKVLQGLHIRHASMLAIFLAKGFRYQKIGLKPTCPKFRAMMRPW
jgi:hypothetical protein